jgi:hypothetical protein
VPAVQLLYLPLIADSATLVWVVNTAPIPVQPATERGMIYWTAHITLPVTLPTTGQYVLSSHPDRISPTVVDDGLVISVSGNAIFRYDYGAAGPPQPSLVTIPLITLAPWVGQTITVQFQDLHGSVIGASPMYLLWVP